MTGFQPVKGGQFFVLGQCADACYLRMLPTTGDSWGKRGQDSLFCADAGEVRDVVLVPIGFLSDHIEVLYDLDTEARDVASQRGLNLFRAESVGCHPRFVRMIRELIVERVTPSLPRLARGTLGASHNVCPQDCCPSGRDETKVAGRRNRRHRS